MLTNNHPIIPPDHFTIPKVKENVLAFEHLSFPLSPVLSTPAKHLLERMIAKEQSHRYSAAEALTHPWITRNFNSPYPLLKGEKYLAQAE
jgi:serine/threonine protein kinase